MNALTMLEQSDFFRSISTNHRVAVAAICIPKVLRKKETLFMEGERGQAMYLLAQGTVQLSKTSEDGKEVVIKVLKPGEIFGEVILFEREDYPVTACSLTPVEVFLLPKRQFRCLLEDEGFRTDFLAMLLGKQRYLTDRIFRLSAMDVEQRFFHFLRDRYGEREEYSMDISKRDVAAAIDALPETLSRLLLRLRAEGLVRWDGAKILLRKGFWEDREP
jgi:CRP/FNR family transcriptional regulator